MAECEHRKGIYYGRLGRQGEFCITCHQKVGKAERKRVARPADKRYRGEVEDKPSPGAAPAETRQDLGG